MAELTSRQRMLRALDLQEMDHVPCCFMSFTALRKRHDENMVELAKAERAMGLDSMLFIPVAPRPERPDHPDLRGLPMRFHPEVKTREWREKVEGDLGILHKEYKTPGGRLTTGVRLSEDWPYGDHVPFIGDYQVPRAIKPLVTEPQDLEALQYFLTASQEEDVARFMKEAEEAHAFVNEHGVLAVWDGESHDVDHTAAVFRRRSPGNDPRLEHAAHGSRSLRAGRPVHSPGLVRGM